jgi:polysaccharide biosynthesis transport protein
MDKQQNSFSSLSEANGKHSFPLLQSFNVTSNTEDEKWDLGWLAGVLRRRAILIALVTSGTIAIAGGLLFILAGSTPPTFAGKFQMLVEPVTADEKQAQASTRAQDVENPRSINVEQSSLDYATQIRVLRSPKLMTPLVKELQKRYPDITYEGLMQSLTISRITSLTLDKKEQGTKLIEVTYQDTDPEKVQFVLEQLSQAYLRYSLKERQSSVRQGIKFIDGQLPKLRERVNSLQRRLQNLRQQYTVVDPEMQGQQLTSQSGTLNQQQAESETQLAEVQAKRQTLEQQLQASNLQTVLGEAPYYQTLLSQYQELESQIAVESARMQPDNPALQALYEKRQNLQNLLRAEANRVVGKAGDSITVAAARNRAITQSEAEVTQQIRELPNVARQYTDLQRELLIATDSLNKFSTRREALQIDAAQQEIPWELIAPPQLVIDEFGNLVNIAAINQVRFLALIAILAILLGVGVGFMVEISQDVLQTADETKRATRLPVLGTIPFDESRKIANSNFLRNPFSKQPDVIGQPEVLMNDSRPYTSTIFVESFRSVYKNIRLSTSANSPIRSLTVSSAEPGDGKTTIAVNLAQAAAVMGQRVLLVDADLRHPQVHYQMNLSNNYGLSDVLTGKVNVKDAIQQSPIRENLVVLTAGQTLVDPLELLTSGKMRALMERFQMVFDLVIYDTPPLLGLADSGLIASQTNGLVFVVRMGKTKRATVSQTLEELKISSTNVLGLVANAAQEAHSAYGYYHPYMQSRNGASPIEL